MSRLDQSRSAHRPDRDRQLRWAKRLRLAAAFAVMAISGLIWNSFGLFLVALEAEFNWSRAAVSGAFGAFALTNALTAPAFGYALGQWDSRRLLAGASVLLGLALAGAASVTSIDAFWLVFGVLGGIGSHCTSSYAIFTVLAGRFKERPATAMAIADAGSGLATFLGLPLIHWIIVDFGWRAAYLILGAAVAILGTSLHLFVLDRVRRAPPRTTRTGYTTAVPGLAILALAFSYFCGSAAYQGLLTQQIALFDQRGVSEELAVWIAAMAGLVIFLWRLLSGYLCDRWGPRKVMTIAAAGIALTFASLAAGVAGAGTSMLLVYPLALGIAFGGQQVLLTAGARQITSLAGLARLLGICRLASGIGMATGPVIAGYAYDMTGHYELPIILLAGISFGHLAGYGTAFAFARTGPRSQVA